MKASTKAILRRLATDEEGIQHVEEGLLLALIALAAIVATTALGDAVETVFNDGATTMQNAY